MAGARHWEQDKDSTLYVGNLAEQTTDQTVWELMLQAGPVVNVHLPKDRVTQSHQGYGFVEFASEEDADYAVKIMSQIRLWGKPIRVNKASADKRQGAGQEGGLGGSQGVGAELFVGNLDSMVDEKVLYETFCRFGGLVAPPKVARDDSNLSKGYAFISYNSFDASDDAIANMHGQYLMNKEITVAYAFKKDGKGERHGDAAERALAAQAKKNNVEVQIAPMPAALVMPPNAPANAPSGPAAMGAPNGYGSAPPVRPPPTPNTPYGGYPGYQQQPPPMYNYPQPGPPQGMNPYSGAPSPGGMNPYAAPPNFGGPPPAGPPGRTFTQSPLQPPPSGAGLPARPPPSAVGYGGPSGMPMGAPGIGGPPGFAAGPPGMGGPPGMSPQGPPGQQHGFPYGPPR